MQVSCPSSGNCAAIGEYDDSGRQVQGFVVSELNGRWGTAAQVPGIAALEGGKRFSTAIALSCASGGSCVLGGSYSTSGGHMQAYLAVETGGTWSRAVEVPGSGALDAGGVAGIAAVSCPAPGNCTAIGTYKDRGGDARILVVNEKNGMLGTATTVPGRAAVNSTIFALSCASPGNCTAVGSQVTPGSDPAGREGTAIAVSEVNGTWAQAAELPGAQALNTGHLATAWSVSCASGGNCGAGGFYTDGSGHARSFVASEVNGTWRSMRQAPGSAAFGSRAGEVTSVSCPAPGTCTAGGYGTDASANHHAFILSEVNGVWGTARAAPVPDAPNVTSSSVYAISCGSAGSCLAIGSYAESGHAGQRALLDGEANGIWRQPQEVPGTAKLGGRYGAEAITVSCPPLGGCGVGGDYGTDGTAPQAFILNAPSLVAQRLLS